MAKQKTVFVEGNTLRVVEDYEAPEGWDAGIRDSELGIFPMVQEQIDGVVYAISAEVCTRHAMIVGDILHAIAEQLKKPCRVFGRGLGFHYRHDVNNENDSDYLRPDVIVACDPSKMLDDGYYGQCHFIAEVASPSTMKYDKTRKFRCYEGSGVSEYWIVNPSGALDIYYLVDGRYELHDSWMFHDEEAFDDYNADEVIALREFPDIKMTLGEIFE